jgi:hypothetical protein
MLPLIENIEKVKSTLANANKEAINPDLFLREKLFDALVEACAACNEICGLALVQFDDRLYCIPQFSFIQEQDMQKVLTLFEGFPFTFGRSNTLQVQRCIQFKHRLYWEKKDFLQLQALVFEKDVRELIRQCLVIGRRILQQSADFLGVVFGHTEALSEEYLRIFNRAVLNVSEVMSVFNHLPFEYLFQKMHELICEHAKLMGYDDIEEFLNEHFYEPLLSSEKEWKLHVIHEKSADARMKRKILATNLKHPVIELGEKYGSFFYFRSD